MRRSLLLVGVSLLAAAFLLGACGGDGGDSAMTTAAAATTAASDGERGFTEEAPATTEAAATTTMGEPGASELELILGDEDAVGTNAQPTPAPIDPSALGRLIVYTASLEIEVDDVIVAGEQIQLAVSGLGGVLFGQETTIGDHPRSVLTIKVPPENFQEALGRLSGVGKLLSQQVFADDVTERVVDTESRITTAEASVERLRAFLATAEGVEAVAELEAQLLERETALELLRGQLRTLENQVSLATIVLVLSEPVPPTPEPMLELVQTAYVGHDGGAGCPGSDSLRVDEGESFTVCFELVNTGDTNLANIEVRDQGMRVDEDDIVVVEGDLEAALQPEARMVLMYEAEAKPNRFPDPSVAVDAVDADGERLRIQVGVESEVLGLRVDKDDSLPGFMDAMRKAWEGMQRLFGVAVIGAGVIIPFLWVPVLLIGAYWFLRRRRESVSVTLEPEPVPEPEPEVIAAADEE